MTLAIKVPADLSVDDVERFPQDGRRYELREGNLVAMAPAPVWHYNAGWRPVRCFDRKGLPASGAVSIKFDQRDFRTADVAVFQGPPGDSTILFQPSEIAIAVEVVSDRSEIDDRVTKPWVYAHAGIPEFWRAERIAGTDDAAIYQFVLEEPTGGEPVYRQNGVTTLSALDKGIG